MTATAATRELVDEFGTTRARNSCRDRLGDLAVREPEQRRGDTHLPRELVRRQTQGREGALRYVEREILAIIPARCDRIPRRVLRGNGWVCTLKRAPKAPVRFYRL